MLSCHDVSKKADDYLDHDLPWWTRAKVGMHLLLCKHCRRYVEQLGLVARTVRLAGTRDENVRKSVEKTLQLLRSRKGH